VSELFYIIADAGCAVARKAVLESGIRDKVSFRNLDYPEVKANFEARGGTTLPALWDGEHLHQGLDAVMAALAHLQAPPAQH
jgi:hypothetical protein